MARADQIFIVGNPKKHELQDPKEKRNIRADEKLLAVFKDAVERVRQAPHRQAGRPV